ncbi:hypothetical protein BGX27_009340, partial [Mortierella sp. AM989]
PLFPVFNSDGMVFGSIQGLQIEKNGAIAENSRIGGPGGINATECKVFANPVVSISKLADLVDLQTFEGCWEWQQELFLCINVVILQAEKMCNDNGWDRKVAATALVIVYFETKLEKEKETWELIVDKAKGWLEGEIGQDQTEAVLNKAIGLLQ